RRLAVFVRNVRSRAVPSQEYPLDARQVLSSEEHLSVCDESRHTEDPGIKSSPLDMIVKFSTLSRRVFAKFFCIGTCLSKHPLDDRDVLDVKVALPETFVRHPHIRA